MWTMIAVSTFVFAFWMRKNPDRAVSGGIFFLIAVALFAVFHAILTRVIAGTLFPVNTIMAGISFCLMLLSAYGFWPHLDLFSNRGPRDFWDSLQHPSRGYSTVIVLGDAVCAARMFYWDILRPVQRYAEGGRVSMERAEGAVFNFGIAFWSGVIALVTLSQLYYLIPESKRHGWTWLTAPFYPMPPRVIRFLFGRATLR